MNAALALHGVAKRFGETRAVIDLDLVVPQGALYGFIGPSGAGKTTAIRLILSILLPDAGNISVLGHASALQAKDRIGYLPEERGAYRKMHVFRFLRYLGQLKGLTPHDADARAAQLLERLGLPDVLRKRCEDLSKGMLQRVQFVGAIIARPDLLILDEPFSGLDPVSVRVLKDVIRDEHRRGATILFSTHVMAHAEELCDHVVMMHRGRKMLDEPTAGLRRQFDNEHILFEPFDEDANLDALTQVAGVVSVRRVTSGCEIRLRPGTAPGDAIQRLAAAVVPARIEIARVTLEDVFVRIVAGDAPPESAVALREDLRNAALAETVE